MHILFNVDEVHEEVPGFWFKPAHVLHADTTKAKDSPWFETKNKFASFNDTPLKEKKENEKTKNKPLNLKRHLEFDMGDPLLVFTDREIKHALNKLEAI